jgi:hypothetical protein
LNPDGLEVREDPAREGLGVFAAREFKAGASLGFFSGKETRVRSRMSLQFGAEIFVEPAQDEPLRNLNHCCDPSARFVGRNLVAARDLRPGDAITIDYNLQELELSSPFACNCGSERCVGEVRGWRHLTTEQKASRAARAGSWLSGDSP